MPRPRPIDVRIEETKTKLEMLQDLKRLRDIQARIKRRRPRRRRTM